MIISKIIQYSVKQIIDVGRYWKTIQVPKSPPRGLPYLSLVSFIFKTSRQIYFLSLTNTLQNIDQMLSKYCAFHIVTSTKTNNLRHLVIGTIRVVTGNEHLKTARLDLGKSPLTKAFIQYNTYVARSIKQFKCAPMLLLQLLISVFYVNWKFKNPT